MDKINIIDFQTLKGRQYWMPIQTRSSEIEGVASLRGFSWEVREFDYADCR